MRTIQLALLIDGENIHPKYANEVVRLAESLGDITVRRVYGDFQHAGKPAWNCVDLQSLGLELVHVPRGKRGGNASDGEIYREVRRLVSKRIVDGVCVASKDGDFSRLARDLNAWGFPYYAIAESNASRKLKDGCTMFLELQESTAVPLGPRVSYRTLLPEMLPVGE